MAKKSFNSEALQYTWDRFVAGDREQEEFFEQALFDTEVASMIYTLRAEAGLESARARDQGRHHGVGDLPA